MCVKKHIHFAISPAEQLKYWFVGIPIVLVMSFLLSTIFHDAKAVVNTVTATDQQLLNKE